MIVNLKRAITVEGFQKGMFNDMHDYFMITVGLKCQCVRPHWYILSRIVRISVYFNIQNDFCIKAYFWSV